MANNTNNRLDSFKKKTILKNVIWNAEALIKNPSWDNATIDDLVGHFTHVIRETAKNMY